MKIPCIIFPNENSENNTHYINLMKITCRIYTRVS